METNVYVDGFNLYHRAVQDTPYRWLDLRKLSERLLGSEYKLNRIWYFTANIRNSPGKNKRQNVYHRALETLGIELKRGLFREEPEMRPLANPKPGYPGMVEVLNREEKGSDVNLGTQLLLDAFDDDYHAALVISNDSDLKYPVQVVRDRFSKRVIIASPDRDPDRKIMLPGFTRMRIQEADLEACQLPLRVKDAKGRWLERPQDWGGSK